MEFETALVALAAASLTQTCVARGEASGDLRVADISNPTMRERRFRRRLTPLVPRLFLALGAAGFASDVSAQVTGLQRDVVFTNYSPLSSNAEIVRRMLSPLAAADIERQLKRANSGMDDQAIALSDARFVVYAPPQAPPRGYGLLVFVPPWRDAKLPPGWNSVLDHYGLIFVSASVSGNDANVLSRRAPFALLAAENVRQRYKVDPERVYVAGFSGGARVALRLALAYPDLFRGAILNAGSDPLGEGSPPLPPRDLFFRFQDSMRLVFVTGEDDVPVLGANAVTLRSLREWCVFDVDTEVTPATGHEVADITALSRALAALQAHAAPDSNGLATCRAAIEGDLAAQFRQVESAIAGGNRDDAHRELIAIDKRFGGLASPHSVELDSELR